MQGNYSTCRFLEFFLMMMLQNKFIKSSIFCCIFIAPVICFHPASYTLVKSWRKISEGNIYLKYIFFISGSRDTQNYKKICLTRRGAYLILHNNKMNSQMPPKEIRMHPKETFFIVMNMSENWKIVFSMILVMTFRSEILKDEVL